MNTHPHVAKVQLTLKQSTETQRGSSYSSTLPLTSALDGGVRLRSRSGHFTPKKGTLFIMLQKAG